MANNKKSDLRPTSPHLQIYAWNSLSFTSILHRLTGVMLYFAVVAISWGVALYTYRINGQGAQEQCDCPILEFVNYILIIAAIFIIFALYYHFLNGIRHLFWDIGKGFEVKTAKKNAILVIIGSILLTLITIALAAYFKFL